MDYTVGSEFLFECFDRTDSVDAANEDLGVFEGTCNRTWALRLVGPFYRKLGTPFYKQQWELRGLVPLRCNVSLQNCSAKDKFIDSGRPAMFGKAFTQSIQNVPLADIWWACGSVRS